ncbi:MAG: tetratricopeptide repeat protein [Burkholderiales bacterium]|nr:tetratricopeptide repeat protein [Burkholderiales bacterium]
MPLDNEISLLAQAQALFQQGNLTAAEQCYRHIISDNPSESRAHFGLAKVLSQLNQPAEAEAAYIQAISLDPNYFEALANLGSLYLFGGRLSEALAYYTRAEKLKPENPEILSNLCYLNKEMGNLDSAQAYGLSALQINPDHVGALLNVGMVFNESKRYEEALPYLQRANALSPGHPLVLHNMGVSYAALEDYEQARTCYLAALEKNPQSVTTLYGLGIVDKYLGNFDEAEAKLKMVLALAPEDRAAREALAYLQLRLGNFREGWANHVCRALSTQDRTVPPQLPQHPNGSHVLLLGEQGLGDELLFLRFTYGLKALGMRLSYRGSLRLKTLLADQDLFTEWLDPQAEVDASAFDAVLSVGNLPYVLGMASASEIPPPLKLRAAPEILKRMSERLSKCAAKHFIGVTWRAGTEQSERLLFKEAPIQSLGELLKDLPGSIVVLQRHPKPGEIEQLAHYAGREVHDFSEANENLEEMLALLNLVHEYIGVSNTNMHLMAGLGRTARVMIPYPADWRWMEDVAQSPWFPGFQIYRQTSSGDWQQVLARLSSDLHVRNAP